MSTKTHILVVDDDPYLRKTLSDILRVKGYIPTTVGRGRKALEKIREEKPAVVLIDLKLEDMSGLELMKAIKASYPDTECIVLTGHASQASAIQAVNLGAYGYMQKPYNMDQLLMTIHRVIEKQQATAEIRKLNEDLEQRVADRMRELSILYEVTAMASESLDLETTLDWSLAQVLVATRSNMGAIHLLNEAGDTLRLVAHQGIPPHVMLQLDSMTLEDSLAGWVIEHRKPLVVTNLATDRRTSQMTYAEGLHFYAGVPMQARGRVLGVLSIFGEPGHQLNMEEVTLLATIADQVGVAVENANLRRHAEQAAVREERGRLARELHDSVTQSLYSLTLFADWGCELLKSGDLEAVQQRLTRISETAQQALKEMRLLIYELRPAALEQEGLRGALQQRLDAVEKRVGVEAHLLTEPSLKLPATVEESFYRIAQEALNNALNHAAATSVTVRVQTEGEQIVLEVADDGTGFDPDSVSDQGGMGLKSMQERVERLGGLLTILSSPQEGTKVKVSVKQARTGEMK